MDDPTPEAALRSLRLAAHLSLGSLAARAQLPFERLAELEAGHLPLDVHTSERLAWVLGVPAERLALAGHPLASFASVVRTLAERSALSLDALALRAGIATDTLEAFARPWDARSRRPDGGAPGAPLAEPAARAVAEALGVGWFSPSGRSPWERPFWVLVDRPTTPTRRGEVFRARVLEVSLVREAATPGEAFDAARAALEDVARAAARAHGDDHPFDRAPADGPAWDALRGITRAGRRRARPALLAAGGAAAGTLALRIRGDEVRASVHPGILTAPELP